MHPSQHIRKKCKKILFEIDEYIPMRGYVKKVQARYEDRGAEIPKRDRILGVRNGRVYDLEILEILRELALINMDNKTKRTMTVKKEQLPLFESD